MPWIPRALQPHPEPRAVPSARPVSSRRGIRLAPLLLAGVMLAAVAVLAETSNPLRTAHALEEANVVCQSPPAESCPTYEDDPLPAEITVWSATLTVGTRIRFGQPLYGWNDFGNYSGASLTDEIFTFGGDIYDLDEIYLAGGLTLGFDGANAGDIATQSTRNKLTMHVGSDSFNLGAGTLASNQRSINWPTPGLTWAAGDSIVLKITATPPPNTHGYRTIWNALMTAEQHPTVLTRYGYSNESYGKLTNNIIVNGRTDRGVVDDQFRYPWSGFEIIRLNNPASSTDLVFDSDSYPSANEVAGWTLVLDGKELPFAAATNDALTPHLWSFSYAPGWTAGDQVAVSIRNEEVQNRYGQVYLKARRSTTVGGDGNIVYGKTHYTSAIGSSRFGFADSWELLNLRVKTDKTGDTDPVWITAHFRAPDADTAYQGWWEGQFDDFHTLFLRWIYQVDGIGRGAATYTLPLRAAATEGASIRQEGRDITFTWARTYKEFQRRHLDLANHTTIFADFLAPPRPATARSTTSIQNTGNLHGLYTPAPTVTSVEFTSNPGADHVYGPWSIIQATLTFDQDVTVRYGESKREAASIELEMNGETKTAYYERTDGNKVIFQYTVQPGDEEPVALKLPLNSLKLFSERGHQDGSIRNSEGTDAVLDHNGILSTKHRVDAVEPEFSNAQVSADGTQVMVTLTEDIKSPSILRAFGIQTSLLQSLALDVWVDGELPVRSDAAVSGDTVTLTMTEPITQGQTVTVSYDNLFTNSEWIFSDLHGNNLPAFTKQPVTNHSTVADVTQPGGGMALSRTDLIINEASTGTYTVVLTSQPAADVTVAIADHPGRPGNSESHQPHLHRRQLEHAPDREDHQHGGLELPRPVGDAPAHGHWG